MTDYNAKYRDSVFRSYFNEPERLLSLCNAILGTDYQDAGKLTINTLDGIFFDKQKNDISCTIENYFLILVEHQTTVNDNMPFRCLSYVAELLNNLVEEKNKLYHKTLIRFPAPKFFVLYDGDKTQPLKKEMRLSEAFGGDKSSLELVVTAYNINHDVKQPLLKKCGYLSDYSVLVWKVKEGIRAGFSHHEAISQAVKFCLDNGLMKGFLEKNSQEVFNMLALEWNLDDALQARFDDGFAEGRNEGIKQGEILQAEKIAARMIHNGNSVEEILALTDLPLKRIRELAQDNLGSE